MRLLRFHPFPIPAPHLGDIEMSFNPENRFLAITADESLYVELSHDEIKSCNVMNGHFICGHLQVLHKLPSHPSCLTSLYLGKHDLTTQYCDMKIEPKKSRPVVSKLQ